MARKVFGNPRLGTSFHSRIITEFTVTVLSEIIAATRRRVAECRSRADLRDLERRAEGHVPRGFREALAKASASGPAIIAELKKASPSRGLIRSDFNVLELAKELAAAGATALSVLTDEEYFQGSLENLRVSSSHTSLPCLRKDFILDEFQILEARANSADAILLIVAALPQGELATLAGRAAELKLNVLCEVHDEEELGRALDAGCDLIGVNNRDLKTFKVDLNTAFRVGDMLPHGVVAVAESGIQNGRDIARLRAAGYDAFLIGETLMKAESPGQALKALIAEAQAMASGAN